MRYDVVVTVSIPGKVARDVVVTLDASSLVEAVALALKQGVTMTPIAARESVDQNKPVGIA